MRNLLSFVVIGLAVSLAACAARAPRVSTLQPPAAAVSAGDAEAAEAEWWRQFGDQVLDALVTESLAANRDVTAAAARLAAARELAGATRLAHLPGGGATTGTTSQRLNARTTSAVHAGVELGWEADLFGRLRGRTRAATAEAEALAMDARAVQVAVAAQVASAYFDYRGAQREASLLAQLRARAQDQLAKTQALASLGRLTRLDSLRLQQVDDELAAQQAITAHAAESARLRLATLGGRTGEQWNIPETPAALRAVTLPIGGAAGTLRRRPDVVAAEWRLAAAAARAGVARADLFPRLDIGGSVGLIAGSVEQLGSAAAATWLAAPRLAWTFLDWPQQRRRMRAADALADAAFAEYEQRILVALEEVQAALDNYGAASQQLAAVGRRAEASSAAARIVTVQYQEGLVDSLAQAVADRDAIAGALAANRALTTHRQAVVELYRALGGGWR